MAFGVALAFGSLVALTVVVLTAIARRHGEATPLTIALIGQEATALTDLRPTGFVLLQGERWQAEAAGGPVAAGEPVIVSAVNGLRLRVTARRLGGWPLQSGATVEEG